MYYYFKISFLLELEEISFPNSDQYLRYLFTIYTLLLLLFILIYLFIYSYFQGLDFLEDLSSDYENALVLTGFGKFHLLLLAICGLIYLNTAIGVTILSFVLPSATCDFQMTSQDKGWLTASPMLGMLLGSYFWGCLADTKGRKIVLIATLIGDGICGLLSSIAPYYLMFLCIRFFNGFK